MSRPASGRSAPKRSKGDQTPQASIYGDLAVNSYGKSSSLEECARDARKNGFAWVEPIPDGYLVGEVREMAEVNGVPPERTGGFWYGSRGERTGTRASTRPRANASSATSTEARTR